MPNFSKKLSATPVFFKIFFTLAAFLSLLGVLLSFQINKIHKERLDHFDNISSIIKSELLVKNANEVRQLFDDYAMFIIDSTTGDYVLSPEQTIQSDTEWSEYEKSLLYELTTLKEGWTLYPKYNILSGKLFKVLRYLYIKEKKVVLAVQTDFSEIYPGFFGFLGINNLFLLYIIFLVFIGLSLLPFKDKCDFESEKSAFHTQAQKTQMNKKSFFWGLYRRIIPKKLNAQKLKSKEMESGQVKEQRSNDEEIKTVLFSDQMQDGNTEPLDTIFLDEEQSLKQEVSNKNGQNDFIEDDDLESFMGDLFIDEEDVDNKDENKEL
jgi:hypothetical protein